jgi:hypothetical protein
MNQAKWFTFSDLSSQDWLPFWVRLSTGMKPSGATPWSTTPGMLDRQPQFWCTEYWRLCHRLNAPSAGGFAMVLGHWLWSLRHKVVFWVLEVSWDYTLWKYRSLRVATHALADYLCVYISRWVRNPPELHIADYFMRTAHPLCHMMTFFVFS